MLRRCVNTPCCTLQSVTLHHSASPPTQPIVLLRVRVLLIEATDFINPSDNTIASSDLRSAACCCYRCVASAATRSDAASSNAFAHPSSSDTTRDGSVPPRLSHESGRAKLTPRGLRSSCQVRSPGFLVHLHWCSYYACPFFNLAPRVPFGHMSRQAPFSGNSLFIYSS